LDQHYWGLLKITAIHETIARFAARVLRILKMTIVARAWTKEVAMAKVIEFYIPQNFRRPKKWVPELQRGKILELRPQIRKSA
jgi:hypothetical protein